MLLSQKPTGVVLIGGQLRDPAATLPVAHGRAAPARAGRAGRRRGPLRARHPARGGRRRGRGRDAPSLTWSSSATGRSPSSAAPSTRPRCRTATPATAPPSCASARRSTSGSSCRRRSPSRAARRAIGRLVADGAPFTAIFAATDEVAFGAISALRERGLRIPLDVSVVGFDDVVMSAHSDPPLTTIHVPARELGLAAWHLLKAGESGAARAGESRALRARGARLDRGAARRPSPRRAAPGLAARQARSPQRLVDRRPRSTPNGE